MIVQGFKLGQKSPFPLDEKAEYICTDCGLDMRVAKSFPEFLSEFKGKVEKFQCMDCANRELNLK